MPDSMVFLDATMLSRIQFGFTITFHILFPAFSIGLAGFLVVLETLWLTTAEERYWRLLRFWTAVFALSFGMGVVSGIVLAYQFGTNWSGLMAKAGQIMGPPVELRNADRVFPRSELSRRVVVRLEARFAAHALHFYLDGRAGHLYLGVLDHGDQQMDADACRLRRARRFFTPRWWAIISIRFRCALRTC